MRVTGKVTWFDLVHGVGFIDREPGATDCYVRHSALRGTVCNLLAAGEAIEFDLIQVGLAAVALDVIRLGHSLIPATVGGV